MTLIIQKSGLLVVAILFPILDIIAVAARFWVRKIKKKPIESDDWTILLALILTGALSIILIIGSVNGYFGLDALSNAQFGDEDVTRESATSTKLAFAYNLLSILVLGIIKFSTVLLYRRYFSVGDTFNKYSRLMYVVVVVWCTTFFVSTAFQCGTHISALRTGTAVIEEYCFDVAIQQLVLSLTDVLTTIMIFATPLPILWGLHHILRTYNIVMVSAFVLSLLIATASAVVRMAFLIQGSFPYDATNRDSIVVNTSFLVWTHVEIGSTIIATCIPALRHINHEKKLENFLRQSISRVLPNSLYPASRHSIESDHPSKPNRNDIISDRARIISPEWFDHPAYVSTDHDDDARSLSREGRSIGGIEMQSEISITKNPAREESCL
ncbi:hypothetical protein MMC25_000942 [Agyrium rufum]|nr:hypothetical protein [Agyrium rufum]